MQGSKRSVLWASKRPQGLVGNSFRYRERVTPKLGCEFAPQLQWNKLAQACHLSSGEAKTRRTWGSTGWPIGELQA